MTAATAAIAILILQAQAYQFIDLVNDNSCGLRLWPATARLAFSRQSTETDTATNVIAKFFHHTPKLSILLQNHDRMHHISGRILL